MSAAQHNLAVIEAFNKAYNDERIEDAVQMYASDGHLRHVTRGIDVHGHAEIRELMLGTLAMLPGRRSECVRAIAADDVVVTENHYEATAADTTERVTFDFCHIFRLVDGKIVEHREYG